MHARKYKKQGGLYLPKKGMVRPEIVRAGRGSSGNPTWADQYHPPPQWSSREVDGGAAFEDTKAAQFVAASSQYYKSSSSNYWPITKSSNPTLVAKVKPTGANHVIMSQRDAPYFPGFGVTFWNTSGSNYPPRWQWDDDTFTSGS